MKALSKAKQTLLAPLYHLENRLTFKPTIEDYGGLPAVHDRVSFGAEFGLRLDGAFIEGDSKFVVLFVHGNRYNLTRFRSHYGMFDQLGVSFFTFDYPGYGRSLGTPNEAAAYASVRCAYAHLVHARGIAPERIIVYGLSLGAALSAELLLTHPATAFIAECPFTNSWDMAKHLYPHLPIWWIFPNRFRNDLKFPLLKLPLFIFHGKEDPVTPSMASVRLFDTYNAPKQITLIDGAHHNDCLDQGGTALREKLQGFLASL